MPHYGPTGTVICITHTRQDLPMFQGQPQIRFINEEFLHNFVLQPQPQDVFPYMLQLHFNPPHPPLWGPNACIEYHVIVQEGQLGTTTFVWGSEEYSAFERQKESFFVSEN